MLGLNIDVDIKKSEMPFYFKKKNECVHCGKVNSLKFIDKFGRENRYEVGAFDHIRCANCGMIYSIKWDKDDYSNKMYPSAVEPNISQDFMNLVNFTAKNNGVKTLEEE